MRKEDELLLQGTSVETPKYRDANPISHVIVIRDKNEWDLKKGPAFRKVIEDGGPSLRMGSPCADYRVAEQANRFMAAYFVQAQIFQPFASVRNAEGSSKIRGVIGGCAQIPRLKYLGLYEGCRR